MDEHLDIFAQHYRHYCRRLAEVDLARTAEILGLTLNGARVGIPFFNQTYWTAPQGITDAAGRQPSYAICVILAKYLLLCPERIYADPQWTAFQDFKKTSHFTNVNYFKSDTEMPLAKRFSGNLGGLSVACEALGGSDDTVEMPYDLCRVIPALPRISLLLLFNDADEEFPAKGTVLFPKHAEHYLDPESLAMTSAFLVRCLGMEPLTCPPPGIDIHS